MNIEDLGDHFEMVRRASGGFTARCPAHDDRLPSLSVRRGNTGILVKCQAGCSFLEVVEAAGLQPLDFKYDVDRPKSSNALKSERRVRDILRKLRHKKRPPLTTVRQVVEVALEPPAEWLEEVSTRYHTMMNLEWEDALKMWVVLMDGPVFMLCYSGGYDGDWRDDKEKIGRLLWQTYRKYQ